MRLVASTALFASLVDASPNGTASRTARPDMPHYPLFNAAEPGTTFPAIGFGSGAYGSDPQCEARPGCMSIASGCGDCAYASMLTWLRSGGRRLDLAHGYNNDAAVARAIADSGVPRSELFILSKISLGHADALLQISNILRDLETDYVDALLIHWPTRGGTGLDPLCNPPVDERACRISTWRAMLEIFHRGSARSIGVSNYYPEHFAVRASSKLNASSQSTGGRRQAQLSAVFVNLFARFIGSVGVLRWARRRSSRRDYRSPHSTSARFTSTVHTRRTKLDRSARTTRSIVRFFFFLFRSHAVCTRATLLCSALIRVSLTHAVTACAHRSQRILTARCAGLLHRKDRLPQKPGLCLAHEQPALARLPRHMSMRPPRSEPIIVTALFTII